MIALAPPPPGGADPRQFAHTLLGIAAELDAAEAAIKEALLAAARGGDMARVITILERWQTRPATEVLKGLA